MKKTKYMYVLVCAFILVLDIFPEASVTSDVIEAPFEIAEKVAKRNSKIKSIILCQSQKGKEIDPTLLRFGKIVFEDLDFTDQFDISLQKTEQSLGEGSLKKALDQGFSLVFFLSGSTNGRKGKSLFSCVVKEAGSGQTVFEKRVEVREKSIVLQSHSLAGDLLEALTGDRGVCLSSIVYCKMLSPKHKVICLSDYSCRERSVIVPTKTINFAASLHPQASVVFFSQLTKTNNRLMSIDLSTKKQKVICSYDGLNMQPAFSPDGQEVVLCLSGGRGNSELYLYDTRVSQRLGRRVFKPLTQNGAHNVSPCMVRDGNIVFCSDYKTGMPQIYHLNRKTKSVSQLTNGKGYAASPSYCAKTNMLVYSRPVAGVFQLFTLCLDDLNGPVEQQVTFCDGNKYEPCWSPDGRYLMFSYDYVSKKGGMPIQQVAALNYLNYKKHLGYRDKKIRVLTKGMMPKSFPHWSEARLW